jgi:hypothetical protein
MDPTANLREQLELATDIQQLAVVYEHRADQGERLAELVLAFDQWIRSGGFLPDQWASRRGTL